jgi:hypothetical protein
MSLNPLVKSVSIAAITVAAAATIPMLVAAKSGAYFSSTDAMSGNTMQTDVVKVKVDFGHGSFTAPMDYIIVPGASYGISAAMINQSIAFPVTGYVSVKDDGSDQDLWDAMVVTIRQGNIGNGPLVYQGPLNKLGVKKLVDQNGPILVLPGQESPSYSLSLTLPETGQDQSALMGKDLKFSWEFTGAAGSVDLTQNL